MVIPDSSSFVQDRSPGLVRELHRTLQESELHYRNLSGVDYEALIEDPTVIAAQTEEGYLLGAPYGRELRLYYHFNDLRAAEVSLGALVTDLAELASEETACNTMVMDHDHGHRHIVHLVLLGADFAEPEPWSLMRCRDIREAPLRDEAANATVRKATAADATTVMQLDGSVRGERSIAPPLPTGFIEDARWLGLAEIEGKPAGYLRIVDAEKRGLRGDHFIIDPDLGAHDAGGALLRAAIIHGREDNRRALTIETPEEQTSEPYFGPYGFKRVGERLRYRRPVDIEEIRRAHRDKAQRYFKVGKIWGTW